MLELGTGAGPLAIALARAGAEVDAVEINDEAAAVARANIAQEPEEVRRRVRVIVSNLYERLPEEIQDYQKGFDHVMFSHPVGGSEPKNIAQYGVNAGAEFRTIRRALEGLPRILKPSGSAFFWILFSDDKRPAQMKSDTWNERWLRQFLPENWSANAVHQYPPTGSQIMEIRPPARAEAVPGHYKTWLGVREVLSGEMSRLRLRRAIELTREEMTLALASFNGLV